MELNYLKESFSTIDEYWQKFLYKNCSDSLKKIDGTLINLSTTNIIYPPKNQILRALELAPQNCKVVILGQDPYHGDGEANGLAFAVNSGIKTPPSLRNIFKELVTEYNTLLTNFDSNLLNSWTRQGVMLLNTTLTVIKDRANSLANIGWDKVTDGIIHEISEQSEACVFILWGNYARSKKTLINHNKHLILESVHPSPLSANRGFFGCNHFTLTNNFLQNKNITTINWLK